MENMCPVLMHINTFNLLTIYIASKMIPFFNYKTFFTSFMCDVSKCSTK